MCLIKNNLKARVALELQNFHLQTFQNEIHFLHLSIYLALKERYKERLKHSVSSVICPLQSLLMCLRSLFLSHNLIRSLVDGYMIESVHTLFSHSVCCLI